MADFSADFEAGVHGNTVTTGAGEASATAFDAIGGTPVYDSARAAHGALGATCNASGDYVQWTLASVTDHYLRAYYYFPNSTTNFVRIGRSAASGLGAININLNASMKLQFVDSIGAPMLTGTTTVAVGQWIRIECHMIHSTTVGQVEFKLFHSPDSSTPTETGSSTASFNTLVSANQIDFGWHSLLGGGSWTELSMDDLVANATSYPGAAAPETNQLRTVASPLRW